MTFRRETIEYRSFMSLRGARHRGNLHRLIRIQGGFSLIELIVTVLLVAIFGSMIIVFFGSSIIKSSDPVTRLKQSTDLNKVMENIIADYNKYPKWKASTSYSVNKVVIPTNVNGRCYIVQTCTGSCSSGANEPNWLLPNPIVDNEVNWGLCTTPIPPCAFSNGKVHYANSLTTLQGKVGTVDSTKKDNDYGKYYVTENKFIKFTAAGSETDDASGANETLKVTIKNDISETLTALFLKDYLL